MSLLVVVPDVLGSAASDLAEIGSALTEAHAAAAVSITGLVPAAEDEVSGAVAALFSSHGQAFQALGVQASSFHGQFVQSLQSAGSAFAARRGR